MIRGKKILAIIPARAGSKGIPGKNTKLLGGKPLIAWTVEAARGSRYLDKTVVSTESEEIGRLAEAHGASFPFLRPKKLATDKAGSDGLVLHALQELPGFDYFVLLQPTSPFRTSEDIDQAIELMLSKKARSCVSVVEAPAHPFLVFKKEKGGTLVPFCKEALHGLRRQDMPEAFMLNGAIFAAETKWFKQTRKFVDGRTIAFAMPESRSLDIDTPADWAAAEKN